MSEPKFPDNPPLTREEAINQIISSIAMEELGLSHVINSEGEKIQYVLGTLDTPAKLTETASVEDLLAVNKSVRETLDGTMSNQMFLNAKLKTALSAATMQGPPGPVGTILDSYNSIEELKKAHPTGKQGDAYLVNGYLYVWDTENNTWKEVGNLRGPEGPMGPRGLDGQEGPRGPEGPQGIQGIAGTVGTIKGSYESEAALRLAHPDGGAPGDFYYIAPDLWVWDEERGDWINVGKIAGPQGIQGVQGERGNQGPAGPTGPVGTILASYGSYDELIKNHPTGNQGEAYLVNGDLYVWDVDSRSWKKVGNLSGPEGPQGPRGLQGQQGPPGPEASSFTIIPFASQKGPRVYAANGVPTRVALLGFGYLDNNALISPDVSVPLNTDGSFNLGLTSGENRQLAFSLPFDMTVNSIYITVGNYGSFSPPGAVFPYVQLYAADAGSNTFKPIENAFAKPAEGIGPGNNIPAATMRAGSKNNLNIQLPAGTRIAIGGLMEMTGSMAAVNYYLYYTGGIGMTRWVR